MHKSEQKTMQEVYFNAPTLVKSGATHFEINNKIYQFSDIVSYNARNHTIKLKDGSEFSFEANVDVTFKPIVKAFR